MADMKLVVVGAAGRMGRTLVRVIAATEGVTLHAAIERPDANEIGTDAGTLAGLPPLGVPVTADPLAALVKADGVLDFTVPAATIAFAEIAAQARIVHVIGTTGLSDADETACKLFDVIKMKNMYGKKVRGIERSTFVIDANGRVCKEWRGVKVAGHAQEVLDFVKTLS